ncbi:MAG: hypothetical protein ABSF54_22525, partial [Bryobacteraceae bacterium]
MAARLEPAPPAPSPNLVDLRHLRSEDLNPLLDEEVAAWHRLLDWDFSKSADLVRRFVDMRALNGFALVDDGEAAGYAYYVLEEHKGLVGDLFVRESFRTVENENRLLESVLGSLAAAPQIGRIESQLMMCHSTGGLPMPRYLSAFERNFMMLDMPRATFDSVWRRPGIPAASRVYVEKWADQYQDP